MKKIELKQMENLEGGRGGTLAAACAMAGFLFLPAHGMGPSFGGMARSFGSVCMDN